MASAASEDSGTASRPETTRDVILRTAKRVFLERGYEQTSMDEIALRSGVARRTLYNQFASKKALFDATMARAWERMTLDALTGSTVGARPPEVVLREIGRAIAAFWAPPEAVALLRLVIWESARFPELGESFLHNGRAPARRAVTRYVERLSGHPDFAIDDPELAATAFLDVILGEVVLERLVVTSAPPLDEGRCARVVDEAVALFLARHRR